MLFEEATRSLVHRLSHLVMWMAFVLFHVSLLSAFLFVVWIYNIDTGVPLSLPRTVVRSLPFESIWSIAAFFGVSGATVLAIYVWCWKRLYWALAIPYLHRNIEKQREKEKEAT